MRLYYWQAVLHDGRAYTEASGLGIGLKALMRLPMSIRSVYFEPKRLGLPRFSLTPSLCHKFRCYETWWYPWADNGVLQKFMYVEFGPIKISIDLNVGTLNISYA